MGFKSVYRTLQELFPQVDARLLKAAAIEHSKDRNGAVEFILAEVLPYTTKPFTTASSSIASLGYSSSVGNERRCVAQLVPSGCAGSSKNAPTSLPGVTANKSVMNETYHVDPACLNETAHDSLNSIFCDTTNLNDQSSESTMEAAHISGNERRCVAQLVPSGCAGSSKNAPTSLPGVTANESAMNETYHVDPACLDETAHDSFNSIFCDTTNLNDQSSESTMEAAHILGKMNETNHMDLTPLYETVHGLLDLTCDTKDINDHLSGKSVEAASSSAEMNGLHIDPTSLLGDTGTSDLIASRVLEETRTQAVENISCNISFSHAYEEVYNGHHDQKSENNSLEDTPLSRKYKDLDLPDANYSSSSSAVLEDAAPDVFLNNKQDINPFSLDLKSILVDGQKKPSSVDVNSTYGTNYVDLASLSFKDHTLESLDCSTQSEVQNCISSFNTGASKEDIHVPESVSIKESSNVYTVVTRSDQLCRTDLLEDLIEDSKTHKGTLFSAMDSVLQLMREVELKEKVAQQAKEEAANGGLEVLARVDELKRMLNDAREANDMHAGEVYGERAILVTEMRELQSRFFVLSDEKDKSLSILDMMLEALKTRLAAAETERIAAEQEKLAKEESAWKSLAEQELILERTVQESKILQHEAEQIAKLREFLVDRGRAVDTLQGEICVISQDIKLLKENFDSRVSLSQCLSKQTSCILASSGSSLKSSGSQQVLEQAEWSSLDEFLLPSMVQVTASDHDELGDEGWELFDNAT